MTASDIGNELFLNYIDAMILTDWTEVQKGIEYVPLTTPIIES